jgi:hypothetical protein
MKRLLLLGSLALVACATVPAAAGPTARLGGVAVVGDVRIRPVSVVEDSRCPINARCIWAGRLVLLAEVNYRGGSEEFRGNLTLGEPLQLGRETIILVAAEPGTLAGKTTDPRDYRFTFDYRTTN